MPDSLSMLYQLESKLKQDLKSMKSRHSMLEGADGASSRKKEAKELDQRIRDVKKLQRIELIYVSHPSAHTHGFNHVEQTKADLSSLLLPSALDSASSAEHCHRSAEAPFGDGDSEYERQRKSFRR